MKSYGYRLLQEGAKGETLAMKFFQIQTSGLKLLFYISYLGFFSPLALLNERDTRFTADLLYYC